jgi:hypothetical protein
MDKVYRIDKNEVSIPLEHIKQYYNVSDCFINENEEIKCHSGQIFIDEKGNLFDCENCLEDINPTVNEKVKEKLSSKEFIHQDSASGFVYNGKLYFTNFLDELN